MPELWNAAQESTDRATEADGRPSEMYCAMCYEAGRFIGPNTSAEQMQGFVEEVLRKKHWPGFMRRAAAKQIPELDRWK